MKKKLLFVLFAIACLYSSAQQVYREDFESANIGDNGSLLGWNSFFDRGASRVVQGSVGNTSKVLLASNSVGGDHFLRSPLFEIQGGKSYTIKFDISLSNAVYLIRIRTEDNLGNNTLMPISGVSLSTTNGTVNNANASRIENLTPNVFGTTTVTFIAPPGQTKAQLQIYQFGINSFMLDNVFVDSKTLGYWQSEAELGVLAGNASATSGCTNASGGSFVNLEKESGNTLTFNDVSVSEAGTYSLNTKYFYNGGDSYLSFFVNGVFVKQVLVKQAPWCFQAPATSTRVELPLKKGINSIKVAPSQGKPSPFLDRFELSEKPVNDWFSEAEAGSLSGAGSQIITGCTNASNSSFVNLYGSTNNRLSFNNVTVPEAGYYKLNFAYFGITEGQSLNVLVNGSSKTISSIKTGSLCRDGGALFESVLIELNAGVNTLEFKPIGGNVTTPSIDWLELIKFTPATINLALTKQRLMPGETIVIMAKSDIPVNGDNSFQFSITGIDPSDYSVSNTEIIIGLGKSVGAVSFTPNKGIGEKSIQITLTGTTSKDVVLGNRLSNNAEITTIPKTFYVSSSEGDDSNDGKSEATPLKTLARVTELGQITGDDILFKTGDVFNGQLVISASGVENDPIVVSSYGEGDKPLLNGSNAPDGKGSYLEVIRVENRDNIQIKNLAITNPRSSSREGVPDSESFGIYLLNSGTEKLENFVFKNLTITNVFSVSNINDVPFDAIRVTGIFAETDNSHPGSVKYIEDVLVEDCYFSRIGKLGFWSRRIFSPNEILDRESIKNRDVIFRNNTVFENGGSGIVLSSTANALVESNIFEFTGSGVVPNKMTARGSGAWFFQSTDVVAQYNISRHARGSNDSYGMHIDYGNKNILFQYNYSEDSEGGFVEILGDNINSIWRYNISVNDGLRQRKGNTLWISDFAGTRSIRSSKNYIYNNSVYVGNGLTPDISIESNDAYIYNNIFQSVNGSKIGEEYILDTKEGTLDISNNIFDGDINTVFKGLDTKAVIADPKYVEPGKLEAAGYRLFKNSPALKNREEKPHPSFPAAGTGIFAHISEEPTTDFFGNSLFDEYGAPLTPIGAYAGKGLKVDKLIVVADCGAPSENTVKWAVKNPNDFSVLVNWKVLESGETGSILALPGDSFIETQKVMGMDIQTLEISWNDEKGKLGITKNDTKECTKISNKTTSFSEEDIPDYLEVIYPNPVSKNGILNLLISSKVNRQAIIQIYGLDGRIIKNENRQVNAGKTLVQINLNEYDLRENTIVALKVTIGEKKFTRKIIIQ